MTILITGCAGLLGASLSHWLLNNTEDWVVGADDLSGGFESNLPDHHRFVFAKLNVCDNYLDNLFQIYKPQIVYHFACYASEGLSPFIRCFNYKNNIIATANVVNCCIKHNVKRIVFTSSMAVYGNGKLPFSEDAPYNPIDPYAVGKAAAEQDIKIAGQQHGLDWCIIRPHNMYGRYQNIFDPYRNFIGIAIYKALVGDPITVYGDGEQRRAFSEMQDCLEPLWKAAISSKASKQIINLGGIKEYTINEAAKIVSELSGAEIIHLPPRHEVKNAYSTWQKSVDILGFEHKTELKDGVKKMWEWAKTIPMQKRFIWPEYELEQGLYPFWKPEALKDGYYKNEKINS